MRRYCSVILICTRSLAHFLVQLDEIAAARCTPGPALRYGPNGKDYKKELQKGANWVILVRGGNVTLQNRRARQLGECF